MTMERWCLLRKAVASWHPPKANRSLLPPAPGGGAQGDRTRLLRGAELERDQGGPSTQEAEQAALARLELLERDAELVSLQNLVESKPGGLLLAIEGPPGIGKSALLAEAKSRANEAAIQVLGARGSELERSFSFGVVRQLFEPLLASLPSDERTEALSGAAALAEPLFNPEKLSTESGADSSFATLHGLYWLTANVAARQPLLLALDDLHWCDLPSLRWLAYLLPRMEELALLVAAGLRPEEPGEDGGLLGRIVSDPVAAVIRPAPLSTEAATLLLRELVHVIAAEGLAPTAANVPRLRELAGRAGSRAVSLRLSRLPREATALARAVAIFGDDADPRQAAALAGLDEEAGSAAADVLARADVLRPQPPLGFAHPLIRAAVYEMLTPLERERGHARAARLLADA